MGVMEFLFGGSSKAARVDAKGYHVVERARESLKSCIDEWDRIRATVPRNANGWPTVDPKYMTYAQLVAEALKWGRSGTTIEGPYTADGERTKYMKELFLRGYLSKPEYLENLTPVDVPGSDAAERHARWMRGESGNSRY